VLFATAVTLARVIVPNRILREGILTSPNVAKLVWAEEVFYRRLMSVVDDFGRYFGEPGMLRAACYPRQLNKVSDSDVSKWLHGCVDAGLVRVYLAEDRENYVELVKFGQQVRAKKSKYPDPIASDINCLQPPASAHLDVSVSVSEDGGGKRATRIPPDFEPKPEPEAEAGIDRQKELANFRDYWTAKAGKDAAKLDWQATWRQWVRKADRPGVSRFAKPAPNATVPGRQERDPELVKREQDSKNAAPMPAAVLELAQRLKGPLEKPQGATA
jgi:hypothetical protein